MRSLRTVFPSVVLLLLGTFPLQAQTPKEPRELIPPPFDAYISQRVAELSSPDWQKEITPENWSAKRAEMRKELQRMLGLDPWPARGDLKPVITGNVQGDGYVVEKLEFQSSPGLYVTANLYRPAEVKQPLPTILYVCGHSRVIENGVSLGNKTGYEHHGSWFARHGYVCLVLDTIQLGEILGEHWGTYSLNRWWWPARGYTPAGVEAWNGIRALDYLETRPEVDRSRIGITGRSGGGAYSWWIAALDERIKVAAPTAGITTLHNHVVDGAIEGHCDCMFMVNTARWEFDRVAALVAPRPLLIANTDKDEIFPLDGVMEIYNRTRGLYRRLGNEGNIGLQIAEGPHKDTQPLNTGAFHWMERFLKGADPLSLTDEPARKRHQAAALRVFENLPSDEKVTTVDEWFVPAAPQPSAPKNAAEWAVTRDQLLQSLREDCFRAWPANAAPASATKKSEAVAEGLKLTAWEFTSQEPFRPTLWLLHRDGIKPEELELVVLNVLDDEGWTEFQELAAGAFPAQFPGVKANGSSFAEERQMLMKSKWAMAYVCPRGAGPTSFASHTEKKRTQLLRRLQLIGETLESGQVWDIAQTASALRSVPGFATVPLWLQAQKQMAANAIYASLFIPNVKRLDLHKLPASQRQGPTYLNVLRHMDLPLAAAVAAERSTLAIYSDDAAAWQYPRTVATALGWGENRVQLRKPMSADVPATAGR
ncbi:alpha/beta hydrolase family protein [Verrucomicrobiota bacterium sgz303538]